MKRTKILCTIGPVSNTEKQLEAMVKAGMSVCRLNFSHGTHEEHAEVIKRIRSVRERLGEPLAILQDLQGPKIRVGELPKEGVTLEKGKTVVFSTEANVKLPKIPVTYELLHEDVKSGDILLLDDGLLSVKVLKIEGKNISCEVINGGPLTSHKGLNLPTATLKIPAITEKDKEDVKFGVSQYVDWVALSFVRNAKEIYDLRYLIKSFEDELGEKHPYRGHPIRIVAKIEKHEAVKNIDEIIEAADGIMVARGDLGIEMPAQDVPLIQKQIIEKCLAASKPVIVATQMLDSMIRNPRPTRAEVSDVANAVIDHTDAVMLSGETASGKYPLESVQMMTTVVLETEASKYDNLDAMHAIKQRISTETAISNVANILARDTKAKLILVASMSGDTGRIVSRYRPEVPILVATADDRTCRQLNLSWGVRAFVLPRCNTVEELVDRSVGHLRKTRLAKAGDKIIIVAGEPVGMSGGVNLVEIRDL